MAEDMIADMGKYVISTVPDTLTCLALGSCVGVALYDAEKKIGGLSHVMLPTDEGMVHKEGMNVNKYANIAIPNMLKDMIAKGAVQIRLKAKIAGGAHMFRGLGETSIQDIGKRNVESVKKVLEELKIPIIGEVTGGSIGRTTHLFLETGVYQISTKEGKQEL